MQFVLYVQLVPTCSHLFFAYSNINPMLFQPDSNVVPIFQCYSIETMYLNHLLLGGWSRAPLWPISHSFCCYFGSLPMLKYRHSCLHSMCSARAEHSSLGLSPTLPPLKCHCCIFTFIMCSLVCLISGIVQFYVTLVGT